MHPALLEIEHYKHEAEYNAWLESQREAEDDD